MAFNMRNTFMVVTVTLASMWLLNQAAARFPTARRFIRGGPVSVAAIAGQRV